MREKKVFAKSCELNETKERQNLIRNETERDSECGIR